MREEIIKLRSEILHAASKESGVGVDDIIGKPRYEQAVRARYALMFVFVEYFGQTLVEAGRFFRRDHTTVIHARMVVATAMTTGKSERETELKALVNKLIAMIPSDLRGRDLCLYMPSIPERMAMLEGELREMRTRLESLEANNGKNQH